MPRPFEVNNGLMTAVPNRATAEAASSMSSVTVVGGTGSPARTSSHVIR